MVNHVMVNHGAPVGSMQGSTKLHKAALAQTEVAATLKLRPV